MNESSQNAELLRLLNLSVDGGLSDTDEAALQSMLRSDPAARRNYLQFMQLHAELHWDHGAAASLLVSPEGRSTVTLPSNQRSTRRGGGWKMIAISLATLVAGWLLAVAYFSLAGSTDNPTSSAAIASVEMIQGTVSFQGADGDSIELNSRGQSLPAGTILLEGESSAAQWRFEDKTLITVSGDAEISISDDGQKLLRVRQGTFTAEVQPQPRDKPLVIETATARVEVLGTVFTLTAEPEQTRINVVEGRVRLKRLVDGETVEVRDQHSCVASLDRYDTLQPQVPDRPGIGWQHRFTEPPPERWKGEWLPASDELPARVRAVACLVGRKHEADYTPIVHYGISARTVDEISLGLLPANGLFRMRFRTEHAAPLHIMLGLTRADGRFGGNFEAKLPRDAGTPQADGWRELIVPLSAFSPIVQRNPEMPTSARLSLLLVTTYGDDAGLEVSDLIVEDAATN